MPLSSQQLLQLMLDQLHHAESTLSHILDSLILSRMKIDSKLVHFLNNIFGIISMESTTSPRSRTNISHHIADHAGLKLQPQFFPIELRLSEEHNGQISTSLHRLLFHAHKKDHLVTSITDATVVRPSTHSNS